MLEAAEWSARITDNLAADPSSTANSRPDLTRNILLKLAAALTGRLASCATCECLLSSLCSSHPTSLLPLVRSLTHSLVHSTTLSLLISTLSAIHLCASTNTMLSLSSAASPASSLTVAIRLTSHGSLSSPFLSCSRRTHASRVPSTLRALANPDYLPDNPFGSN